MTVTIRIKRVYDPPAADDGFRVLVDRLWPRGVSRERAAINEWLPEIAPSTELRRWYRHQVERWPEFRNRYRQELQQVEALIATLHDRATHEPITLLCATRDVDHSNAAVLKEIIAGRE